MLYTLGLAWQKVTRTTIANFWKKKYVGKDDVTEDKAKLIPLPK
jgi:hypothetical protein